MISRAEEDLDADVELKENLMRDQDLISSMGRSRDHIELLENDERIVSKSIVGASLSVGLGTWISGVDQ